MLNQNNSESLDTCNSCASDLKKKILKEGIWEPYTERIKNLIKSQDELWDLYYQETSFENKRLILEDIVNLQPIISNWYNASLKIIEIDYNWEKQK